MTSPNSLKFPTLHLQFLVIILSLTAVLGREISLTAIPLIFWRTFLAGLALLLIGLAISSKRKLLPSHLKLCFLTGLLLGAHWITFFLAIKLSNISICLAGMTSSALFTSVSEAIAERRRPKRSELILGAAIIPGLLLMLYGLNQQQWASVDSATRSGYLTGFGVALISALLASFFPVLNRKLVACGNSPQSITMVEMFAAAALCAVISYLFTPAIHQQIPASIDWLWIGLLSLVCTVFAFSYHIYLLKYLSAFTTNLAINFEPVYGIILAAIIYNEHKSVSPLLFIGTATIIAVNIIHHQLERLRKKDGNALSKSLS